MVVFSWSGAMFCVKLNHIKYCAIWGHCPNDHPITSSRSVRKAAHAGIPMLSRSSNEDGKRVSSILGTIEPLAKRQDLLAGNVVLHHVNHRRTVLGDTPRVFLSICTRIGFGPCCIADTRTTKAATKTRRPRNAIKAGVCRRRQPSLRQQKLGRRE